MIVKLCNRSFVQGVKLGNGWLQCAQLANYSSASVAERPTVGRSCDVLVVGGGAGGCSVAAKLSRQMKHLKISIVEPSDFHYYQPMFTLVGGGIKEMADTVKPMKDVLPSSTTWIKNKVKKFDPDNNKVVIADDSVINYKYMVVSCGIELNYDTIPGLVEALAKEDSGVCSIYSPLYAPKTYRTLQKLRVGNAIFTFPNTPVKCAGAPLKVCFLAEHYTRINKLRDGINFHFKTALPFIFAVQHYATPLKELSSKRNINVDLRKELIAVKSDKKEATFRNLEKTYDLETISYSMLHVTPPMSPPAELKAASTLVDKTGYLNVDKCTLQHVTYKNVFGIGDCTNLPTSKTAAAVAAQSNVVATNLGLVMSTRPVGEIYNGYTSCPLVTGYGTCILAEFDYEKNPLETFPIDQRKERAVAYYLKRDILPSIYWLGMKGYWNGPKAFRKLCHLGLSKY